MTLRSKLMVAVAATAVAGLSATAASADGYYKKHPRVLSEAYSSSSGTAVKVKEVEVGYFLDVDELEISHAQQRNASTVAIKDGYSPASGDAAASADSSASTTGGFGGKKGGGYGGGGMKTASTSNGGNGGNGGSSGTSASASGSSSASGSVGGSSD